MPPSGPIIPQPSARSPLSLAVPNHVRQCAGKITQLTTHLRVGKGGTEEVHIIVGVYVRLRSVLRREGVFSLWLKLLRRLGCTQGVVLERSLDQVCDVPSSIPVLIELLTSEQSEDYATLQVDAGTSELKDRLTTGNICFVARYEGQLVACCWAATGAAFVRYFNCDLSFSRGEVYLYDTFTKPQFRGTWYCSVPCNRAPEALQEGWFSKSHPGRQSKQQSSP